MNFKRFSLLAAGALLFIHLALGVRVALNQAQTYDEAVHLASSYSFWKSGQYRIDALMTPPLPGLLATLPLLYLNPDPMLGDAAYREKSDFAYADHFLYGNRVPAEELLHTARIFIFLLLSPLLGWIIFRWASELGDTNAGLAALFFYAFNPTILANGPLATSDFCTAVFVFLCLYVFSKSLQSSQGSAKFFLLTGLFFGLALSSKHSAIVLIGFLSLIYGAYFYSLGKPVKLKKVGFESSLVILGALLGLALIYRPQQFPLWWEGLRSGLAMAKSGEGRISYLLGQISITGWWYYFPLAFLMKTPIPLILFMLMGSLGISITEQAWKTSGVRFIFAILPAVLWMTVACLSPIQIGIRYILPIYPFCCLIAGLGLADFLHAKNQAWRQGAVGILIPWYLISALRVHPDYLTYFNEAVGGPDHGYKLLTDSNFDWGQGLKALGNFLATEKNPPIYLSYFGTADPHAYGIQYVPTASLCEFPRIGDNVEPYKSEKILFAISATNFSGVYYKNRDLMKWLDAYEPYKILGRSIFIYDLTHKPEALEHVARILAMTGDRERSDSLLHYLKQPNHMVTPKQESSAEQDHRFAAFIQEYTVPASWVIISEPMSPDFDAHWRKYTKRRYQALSNFLNRAPKEEALTEFSKSLQFYIQHGIPIYVLSDLVEENSHPSPLLDLAGITLKDIHRCFGPGYAGSIASFDENRRLYLFLPQDRLEPLFCVFAYNFLIADESSQIQRTGEILEKIASTMSPSQRRKTAALLKESEFGARLAFDSLAPSISAQNRRKGLQTFQDYLSANSANLQPRFKKLDQYLHTFPSDFNR